MKYLTLIIGIVFSMYSCSSSKQQTLKQETNTNFTWALTHMNSEKVAFKTTLKLDKTTYSGRAACNGYSGSINELTATELSFGGAMATRMACPNLDKEQSYFDNLQAITHYKIENNILMLYNVENELLLVFTKASQE